MAPCASSCARTPCPSRRSGGTANRLALGHIPLLKIKIGDVRRCSMQYLLPCFSSPFTTQDAPNGVSLKTSSTLLSLTPNWVPPLPNGHHRNSETEVASNWIFTAAMGLKQVRYYAHDVRRSVKFNLIRDDRFISSKNMIWIINYYNKTPSDSSALTVFS
jgi:hypothetical protein